MTESTTSAEPQVTPSAEPGANPAAGSLRTSSLARFAAFRDYGVLIALVVLFIVLAATANNFLTKDNLLNVLDQSTSIGIIATAGTLVIVAGGFDLSVGAIFAICGVLAAKMANGAFNPVMALALGALFGGVIGLGNGFAVARVRINPFITTLASSFIVRGAALAITSGNLIVVTKASFGDIGSSAVGGVSWRSIIFLIWAATMAFLLAQTTFGRYIYACGGNEEAARLSGIRVAAVRASTFVISGLAAGLAGILSASQVSTGQADAGVGLELTAVAAVVVGGTSIWGGEGAVWRTVVGVFLLALIQNGFNLLGIDQVYQQVVFGSIILLAAGVDARLRRRTV
jgi:ribose transport system permease protein